MALAPVVPQLHMRQSFRPKMSPQARRYHLARPSAVESRPLSGDYTDGGNGWLFRIARLASSNGLRTSATSIGFATPYIGKPIAAFFGGVEPKEGAISVMPLGFLPFAHRYNPNGTCDSICPRCFQTIATVRDEAQLPRIESQHVCDPHLSD